MTKQLFSVPVAPTNGSFVCTTPSDAHDNIYLLTFTSGADNRLTPEFLDAFTLSLDILEHQYPRGVLLTTSGIQKFFSNGLDLEKALSSPGFFENYLFRVFRRLLTYPMPTIALINGHAFAGGFMLAMYHDYRIQNPKRGFLCLNEIALGIPLAPPMRSVFISKIQDGETLRSMIIEGKRYTAQEALQAKIVDGLGDLTDAVQLVLDRGLLKIASSPAFVAMKERLWADVVDSIDSLAAHDEADELKAKRTVDISEEGKKRMLQWEKSKL
ncbi:enoyl-CoA hydratase/isomerase family protein [Talaromyces stipitatus ATCC 10500]|uniref:Enoyl-CoA hydratase/isomerase family protein n=1 Tax=Talaromyces stipitatus (strain ATCC 10500 / CBS 375.48 / QM 6759 / NRRL 1006) TaxID=441959 RepID=B8MRS9_TALSN|nr:enoyl-CoA hydratase/isomerase family protein [Talaromyces stipitatus ATCC 10500]EED13263.1 enoyl-CoA hydratase/isomerase family protein [Talaromyces stipitatus ATCC 10500]